MKNPLKFAFVAGLLTLPFVALGSDEDLSGPRGPGFAQSVSTTLAPDRVEVSEDPRGWSLSVWREKQGRLQAVPGLVFSAPVCADQGLAEVKAALQDRHVKVQNRWGVTYQIKARVPCQGHVKLLFQPDSPAGQAVGIWQVTYRAEKMLEAEVGLDFWTRTLPFTWPSDGDYYSFGQVNITRGDHWDVVGHEMGHAIYDMGDIGAWGGGQHKIDECYSAALALSEGWASYFSAWVSVDRRDPDAKFEFMVPRRSPIRFENIPGDVCLGPTNEWRVTGFFWDLIDFNNDGETSDAPFQAVWEALTGHHAKDMSEVRELLEARGFKSETLQSVWERNFSPSSRAR
ncbi:MAG: hypothetical protein KF865_07355 [Bdellovibrionaceae bacterium]|nr:hypothetical protein [Pseudobdellovibrionaceae bacterium]